MKLRNTILIGTAALGLTLAAPNCDDKIQQASSTTSNKDCGKCPTPCAVIPQTQRQIAINALEKRLNIEDTISTRYKIVNDSIYTRNYPNGIVETCNLSITAKPGERLTDTTYEFDFNDILPSYAIVEMINGKPADIYVKY